MTRPTCASLPPATNPVAASRRICPKPASGGHRYWESFNNKKGNTENEKEQKVVDRHRDCCANRHSLSWYFKQVSAN